MKRMLWMTGALLLAVTGLATAAGAQPDPNTNTVAYWCGSEDAGIKIEGPFDSVTVPEPPEGTIWTLLVLKAGSEEGGSVEEENEQFPDPVVGETYIRSDGKGISHAILCHEEETPPTTSTSTTSTTTGETTTTTGGSTTSTTTVEATTTTSTVGSTTTVQESGTTTTEAAAVPTGSSRPRSGGSLPVTGASIGGLVLVGTAATLAGFWLRHRAKGMAQ
jgi:hypothetical protein